MKSRLVSMLWKFILGFQIPILVINAGNPYNSGGRVDGAGALVNNFLNLNIKYEPLRGTIN